MLASLTRRHKALRRDPRRRDEFAGITGATAASTRSPTLAFLAPMRCDGLLTFVFAYTSWPMVHGPRFMIHRMHGGKTVVA
jgi:hypothetical protein